MAYSTTTTRPKTITIDVTAEDIAQSVKQFPIGGGGCDSCPIHNALQRHPELTEYIVGETELYGKDKISILLPRAASVFSAAAYEHNADELKPFSFILELP
jgi:hypothetical protein